MSTHKAGSQNRRSLYETTVVVDRAATTQAAGATDYEMSSKTGLRYLVLAVVVTIVSILHFNVFSLACSIPAIIYATKARNAASEGDKRGANNCKKTSFAFTIIAIIGWIVVLCVVGFAVYTELCGFTGTRCNTKINF